jgi:hypothetical protein
LDLAPGSCAYERVPNNTAQQYHHRPAPRTNLAPLVNKLALFNNHADSSKFLYDFLAANNLIPLNHMGGGSNFSRVTQAASNSVYSTGETSSVAHSQDEFDTRDAMIYDREDYDFGYSGGGTGAMMEATGGNGGGYHSSSSYTGVEEDESDADATNAITTTTSEGITTASSSSKSNTGMNIHTNSGRNVNNQHHLPLVQNILSLMTTQNMDILAALAAYGMVPEPQITSTITSLNMAGGDFGRTSSGGGLLKSASSDSEESIGNSNRIAATNTAAMGRSDTEDNIAYIYDSEGGGDNDEADENVSIGGQSTLTI